MLRPPIPRLEIGADLVTLLETSTGEAASFAVDTVSGLPASTTSWIVDMRVSSASF